MLARLNTRKYWSSLVVLISLSIASSTYAKDTFETGYFIAADNHKLFYRHSGSGKENIIYVHGGPGFDSTDGGYEFDDLAKNYHFIAYDQRGGGNSDVIENPELLTVQHHIDDLEALRKHFKFEKMTLMGMSWGTGLSLMYANQYPHRVERLILTAPMPLTYNMLQYRYQQTLPILNKEDAAILATQRAKDLTSASNQEIIDTCRIYVPLLFKKYESPYSDWSKLNGDYCGPNPQGLKMRWKNNKATMDDLLPFDWREIASNINIPSFITEGELSTVPLVTTNQWGAYLPNSRMKYIPKSGHIIWLDNTQQVMKDIDTFMTGQWPENAYRLNPTHLDLMARYTFENSMVNAQDNWFHPKATGKISYTKNRFGRSNAALSLKSTNSEFKIPAAKWYVNKDGWTISGWFNFNKQKKSTFLTHGSGLKLNNNKGNLSLTIGDLTIQTASKLAHKKWQHIAISRDQNTIKLYIDSQLVAAGNLADIKSPEGDFIISDMVGKIDDIRVYARVQSDQQVSAIYHQLDTK